MKLKPLNDWAVIRPTDAAEKTAGGLYIPDSAKEKPQEGVIEAIGPGAYEEEKFDKKKKEKKDRVFIPTTVKPGDLVLYEKYAGQTYTIGGEDLILVRERDILGTLSGSDKKNLQIPASTSSEGTTSIAKKAASQDKRVTKPSNKKTKSKK